MASSSLFVVLTPLLPLPEKVNKLLRCQRIARSFCCSSSPSSKPHSQSLSSKCLLTYYHAMGQFLDKLQGKEWRRRQIRKITDKVFDHIKNESGRASMKFEDLYIGVLLVFNDINKHLPGPHFDPPTKEHVRVMIQEHDLNLDGEIDREEFAKFIKHLTADTFIVVSQGLILTLVAAPTIAMATKRATEGVPGVGKFVQRLPNSVYAFLLTVSVLLFQHARKELK